MSKWTSFREKYIRPIVEAFKHAVGYYDVFPGDYENADKYPDASTAAETHSTLYLASCWDGNNAEKRMMNILSPKFSDDKFKEYVSWMLSKGCNTAHLIYANEGDGEGAGYYATDNATLSRERIDYLVKRGFAIIPWMMTDDSKTYASAMFKYPDAYVKGIYDAGLLNYASLIVLGLEMDEYGSESQWRSVRDAVKKYAPGVPIGVHHTSGKLTFAGLGDVVLDQLDPKKATVTAVKASISKIRALGKDAIGFEYSRHADRDLAQAALDAGAVGCGNWDGGTAPVPVDPPAKDDDDVPYSELMWTCGGFRPGKSPEIVSKISSLSANKDKMSYKWVSGGCEKMGAKSASDAENTIACLFVLNNGEWSGGKFDWISTSRTSRDFTNIKSGYNGWDPHALERAEKVAFVIVGKDGKRRTNVIVR